MLLLCLSLCSQFMLSMFSRIHFSPVCEFLVIPCNYSLRKRSFEVVSLQTLTSVHHHRSSLVDYFSTSSCPQTDTDQLYNPQYSLRTLTYGSKQASSQSSFQKQVQSCCHHVFIPYQRRVGEPFLKDRSFRSEQWLNISRFLRKTSQGSTELVRKYCLEYSSDLH